MERKLGLTTVAICSAVNAATADDIEREEAPEQINQSHSLEDALFIANWTRKNYDEELNMRPVPSVRSYIVNIILEGEKITMNYVDVSPEGPGKKDVLRIEIHRADSTNYYKDKGLDGFFDSNKQPIGHDYFASVPVNVLNNNNVQAHYCSLLKKIKEALTTRPEPTAPEVRTIAQYLKDHADKVDDIKRNDGTTVKVYLKQIDANGTIYTVRYYDKGVQGTNNTIGSEDTITVMWPRKNGGYITLLDDRLNGLTADEPGKDKLIGSTKYPENSTQWTPEQKTKLETAYRRFLEQAKKTTMNN
ncbi:hypothetical protein COV18_05615 [Candidatus Woesearchaeota archaeon CG10_big_fil_rev_8_21_14_0_10_37_12]|nr:MAG: hypothetical protein COV18_05615 [Candidatus Woesearchaeota archaeon CG10_big_fil_rev_8_21_14_0_10_37_12]